MTGILDTLLQNRTISPLNRHFAGWIADHYRLAEDSLAVLCAASVSQQGQLGHVCIDLQSVASQPMFPQEGPDPGMPRWPPLPLCIPQLQRAACIGTPARPAPLILDADKLYLARFWNCEQRVTQALLSRLETGDVPQDLRSRLDSLFDPAAQTGTPDWQKVACAMAVSRRFAVISGGPGTGKTTTVVKILALLLQQQPSLRICLAAPTGKAAARLIESANARKSALNLDVDTLARIPDQATTLHRLLGFDGSRYRYSRDYRLPLDCVVVDEASMIDLPLLASLLDALEDHCRILLLGDRDQLASVEAGNVLGDICGRGQPLYYSPAMANLVADGCGVDRQALPVNPGAPRIADSIALLRTSYRFSSGGGIGRLAKLVHEGDGAGASRHLDSDPSGQTGRIECDGNTLAPGILERCIAEYQPVLECNDARDALQRFEQFRVLCALNHGTLGIDGINREIASRLRPIHNADSMGWFSGTPLIITVNDYELELYNGDIGLMWADRDGSLRAWFRRHDGYRDYALRSLPEWMPAWAMTIHKSQGSEFDRVLVILPEDRNNPLLTRELLYTGITRARREVIIHGPAEVFADGCRRRTRRSSGLMDRLGWPPDQATDQPPE